MTDDLFEPLTAANPAATPRKCRHPKPVRTHHEGTWRCMGCGHIASADRIRGGRRNRNRGNAIEREIGHKLGLRRVGQYGGPDDLSGDLFAVQVKSGVVFPERLWYWLRAVPSEASQTPLLVVTDAPGPGRPRRSIVILTLEDWIALHGPTEEEA